MNTSTRKHPMGLPFLFLSEMWERFGYYLMIGIFTLYLKDVKAGFGMTEAEASDLYGTFIALVFLTPFIGGLLADRLLGYRKSIVIGGVLMGMGYCLMAVHDLNMLYLSMFLVIVGNGFFKPNISTLLGNLYNDPQYKSRKDDGYNIFYMGINVGAFICNFFGAALYNLFGWGEAFIAAGIGMFLGIIIFLIGTKHYKHADVLKPAKKEDMSLGKIALVILIPAVLFGIIGFNLDPNIIGLNSSSTNAFIFACIPVVIFYASILMRANKDEKKPIAAMLAIFFVVIAFWAVFKQNGSTLSTWADRFTDKQVPAAIQKPMATLQLSQTLTLTKDSVAKYDHLFRVQKVNGKIVKEFNYHPYFKNLEKSKWPSEGGQIQVFTSNLYQSVNPGWVILLTPLVVAFFAFLRKRGWEPSTPAKIAWGLIITALSTLVMVAAVYACNNGQIKASSWWFIGSYGVITIGELFLSPMGLSLVSKLSPPRLTALMMGGWFLATSIGNKLSGVLSSMWDKYEFKAGFFWVNFFLLTAAAIIIIAMLKWLNKIFKQYSV
jgi:POT family proton-dependent oligopeptide transporter